MGDVMKCRNRARAALVFAAVAPAMLVSPSANAANLPEIKITAENAVPECATPGRLSAFLEARNKRLDPRFQTIAADYMRIGEEMKIRWDTAFFQMLLETGNLSFTGDVSSKQNNFAGLGASGRKNPGETFPDIATGVKAHIEHLLLYAGEKLDNPVAERTRKVQEWGVLDQWHASIKGPMTYALIAKQWAPTSRNYARDIEGISEAFYSGPCKDADPKPELMALARPESSPKTTAATAVAVAGNGPAGFLQTGAPKLAGADLARRAAEDARESGAFVKSGLGASSLIPPGAVTAPGDAAAKSQPAVTIINAAKDEQVAADPAKPSADKPAAKEPAARVETASLAAGAKTAAAAAPKANDKTSDAKKSGGCKVWTASYGGARSVIIKARAETQDNYTVLDVNEGAEKREADAYIAAYAKGGKTVGEFSNTNQALDKAFELCPEG